MYRRYQMVVMVMYSTFLSVCYYIITEIQGSFEYARIPAYRCPEYHGRKFDDPLVKKQFVIEVNLRHLNEFERRIKGIS
jgi:hypothetical protein